MGVREEKKGRKAAALRRSGSGNRDGNGMEMRESMRVIIIIIIETGRMQDR
jgi:hypothetical protein